MSEPVSVLEVKVEDLSVIVEDKDFSVGDRIKVDMDSYIGLGEVVSVSDGKASVEIIGK